MLKQLAKLDNTKCEEAWSIGEDLPTTEHKGIDWRVDISKWRVRIWIDYEMLSLGCYADLEEAKEVYNKAAEKKYLKRLKC